MARANPVCAVRSGGREGLTFLPASLLCRFIAALASCPVSRASTNCLEMASPKPTLSLQPPHSQPCPPRIGDEMCAVREPAPRLPGLWLGGQEGVSEVMGGNGGCGANEAFHLVREPSSCPLGSCHFCRGLASKWLLQAAKGYVPCSKPSDFQAAYRAGFRSC